MTEEPKAPAYKSARESKYPRALLDKALGVYGRRQKRLERFTKTVDDLKANLQKALQEKTRLSRRSTQAAVAREHQIRPETLRQYLLAKRREGTWKT